MRVLHTPLSFLAHRHMTCLIDMKNTPIDEALREFQKMFLMPVSVASLGCVRVITTCMVMVGVGNNMCTIQGHGCDCLKFDVCVHS